MSYVEHFEFSAVAKKRLILLIAAGAVLFLIGILGLSSGSTLFDPSLEADHSHGAHTSVSRPKLIAEHNSSDHKEKVSQEHSHGSHTIAHGSDDGNKEAVHHGYSWLTRVKMVLWHNNVYFIGVSLIGLFFYAIQFVSWAGWSALLKRVFIAQASFVPIAGGLLIIFYLFFNKDIFHWAHDGVMTPGSDTFDLLISKKSWYLGYSFVLIRTIIYIVGWCTFMYFLRKEAKLQDSTGDLLHHNKSINISAGFIVFFGVSSSMCAWDWIMSIDTHWFSTMFGWYVFASWFVSGIAIMTFIIIELKAAGYLSKVNENHIHDLGKFMFAFSIFWMYIWFAQFILYWYSNIPEEVVWFTERMFFNKGNYAPMFIMNLVINFLFPFFFLMTRDAKRQMVWLKIACVAIFIGHWFDTYLMVMPGVLKEHGGLNFGTFFLELGVVLMYVGGFGFVVLTNLAKLPLISKNDPMLEESINFHQ